MIIKLKEVCLECRGRLKKIIIISWIRVRVMETKRWIINWKMKTNKGFIKHNTWDIDLKN